MSVIPAKPRGLSPPLAQSAGGGREGGEAPADLAAAGPALVGAAEVATLFAVIPNARTAREGTCLSPSSRESEGLSAPLAQSAMEVGRAKPPQHSPTRHPRDGGDPCCQPLHSDEIQLQRPCTTWSWVDDPAYALEIFGEIEFDFIPGARGALTRATHHQLFGTQSFHRE